MDDLRKFTKQDMIDFHNKYYVPNNAVAIYVGDFNPETIVALAEKYFGRIPKGPDLEPIRTSEPPQHSEKTALRRRARGRPGCSSCSISRPTGTRTTRRSRSWPACSAPAAGSFGMRGGGGGGTGRLNKILVEEKQLAVNASASSRAQWYVGAFQFSATPRLDKKVRPKTWRKRSGRSSTTSRKTA